MPPPPRTLQCFSSRGQVLIPLLGVLGGGAVGEQDNNRARICQGWAGHSGHLGKGGRGPKHPPGFWEQALTRLSVT